MSARISAFLVWALAAACAVYWAMRLLAAPTGLPASVQPVSMAGALKGDIARLFTAPKALTASAGPAAEPALASRFKLIGVMAPKEAARGSGQGIALIAVDGKPPRPFRVGAALDDRLVLQAVAARSATLGPAAGAAALKLDMPVLPAPATGSRVGGALLQQLGRPQGAAGPGMPPGEAVRAVEQVEAEPPPADLIPPDPASVNPPGSNVR